MNKVIGIIGDGQLAQMTIQAGMKWNMRFNVVCLGDPEKSICQFSNVRLYTMDQLSDFANNSDVITYEFENIDTTCLEKLEEEGHKVIPSSETLKLIQEKHLQKNFYQDRFIPAPTFDVFYTLDELEKLINSEKWIDRSYVLKRSRGGYNGLGVLVAPPNLDVIKKFIIEGDPHIIEEEIEIEKEYGVMVAVDQDGEIVCYPPVEMHFTTSNILNYLHTTYESEETYEVKKMAMRAVMQFADPGVYGVELFVSKQGKILINEISPRTHNSGHHTIEANECSQFEQLLRICLNLPIGDCNNIYPHPVIMINLLGANFTGQYHYDQYRLEQLLSVSSAHFHDYGKLENRSMRKMGHLTITHESAMDNLNREGPGYFYLEALRNLIKPIRDIVPKLSLNRELESPNMLLEDALPSTDSVVSVIMGSISDLPVMSKAVSLLKEFDIPVETRIVSAHRTPLEMASFAHFAEERGIKVIIAGAGGAAHLPGMTSSLTNLPVIGVPIKSSNLSGLDSLYSIVQMPSGVPVATMAINGALNAGLMAVKILSITDDNLRSKLIEYNENMRSKSINSNSEIDV